MLMGAGMCSALKDNRKPTETQVLERAQTLQ